MSLLIGVLYSISIGFFEYWYSKDWRNESFVYQYS